MCGYNPTFNDAQKRSMKWVVKFLEDKIIEVSGKTWLSTGNLPSELTNIVFNPVAKRDTNKPQCDFKIEDWSDLIIKIGYKDTTFLKISTHQTSNFKLSELGWNGLRLDILKALSVGIYKPKSDGISSRVYDLNRRIKRMVGMNINPIEKDYKNKCRISNVKIEVYNSDERLFDAQIKSDSMIGVGYNKEFDDGYDSNVIYLRIS